MILTTEARLALGGEAIARAPDGRVVFVSGAAPEETALVEITEDKRSLMRARVVRVVTPGASRVEPRCPHFGVCGGCVLQHVDPAVQREAKSDAFVETLRRIGRIEGKPEVETAWGGEPYGYRARARFAYERGRLGYRAAKSRTVVDVAACPILEPAIERAIPRLRRGLGTKAQGEIDVVLDGDRVLADTDVAIEGVISTPTARSFQQSNPAGNRALIETITRWMTPHFDRAVLELYAGSGNFTRGLAARATKVVAVEAVRKDIERAELPPNVDRRADTAERAAVALVKSGARFDAALVDPPRSGLHACIPGALFELGIEALIMVSCDPATFARDAARLAEHGLRLARARLFDFYPQTGHAEVAGLFQR